MKKYNKFSRGTINELRQTAILVSSRLPHPTQQVQIFKKVRHSVFLRTEILWGHNMVFIFDECDRINRRDTTVCLQKPCLLWKHIAGKPARKQYTMRVVCQSFFWFQRGGGAGGPYIPFRVYIRISTSFSNWKLLCCIPSDEGQNILKNNISLEISTNYLMTQSLQCKRLRGVCAFEFYLQSWKLYCLMHSLSKIEFIIEYKISKTLVFSIVSHWILKQNLNSSH